MATSKPPKADTSKPVVSRLLPLVWAERQISLVDLVSEISLPAVVKMPTDAKASDATPTLNHPLLLYKENKGVKVVAKNVSSLEAVTKDGVKYKEGDSTVFVPVDYPGWFRVLDDETVPLKTIATLARHMPVSFLSPKKTPGFSLLDPTNAKDIMYEKLHYNPGLFYVHNIYEDYVKYTTKNVTKRKLLRCLVCIAEEGLEVLFPFDVEGDFYIVEARRANFRNTLSDKIAYAYTLKQLVTMGAFTRPLVLQVLIGEAPSKPCGFTGVVKVFDIVQDRTIIAVSLDGTRKLMELPVLPFPLFIRALNGKDLLETGSLRPELMYMSSGAADKYAREIKVRQNIPLQDKDKQLAAKSLDKQLQRQQLDGKFPGKSTDEHSPAQPKDKQSPRKSGDKQMYIQPFEGKWHKHNAKQAKGKDSSLAKPIENEIYIQPFEGLSLETTTDRNPVHANPKGIGKSKAKPPATYR